MDDYINSAKVRDYTGLSQLFQLIHDCNWKKLRKCLKSSKAYALCQQKDHSNLTCLALALAFGAPLDIIELMLKTDPSLSMVSDNFGATALHVACLNGASIESIDLLLHKQADLVKELDCDKRSALHHAVECACGSAEKNEDDDSIEVIHRLCEIAPELIHFQDKDGDCAMDLVQITMCDSEIGSECYERLYQLHRFLRDISIRFYKEKKKTWEAEGEILRESIRKRMRGDLLFPDLPSSTSRGENTSTSGSTGTLCSIQTRQSDANASGLMNVSVVNNDLARLNKSR